MNERPSSLRNPRFLPDRPLWREGILTFGYGLVGCLLLSPASQALKEVSYGLSTDIETAGGILDILCGLLSQTVFYLTDFLATALLFLGASFLARLAYRHLPGKAVGAAGILYGAVSLSPILTFAAYAILKLSAEDPQTLTLSDGGALLGQLGFSLFRVLLLAAICFLCTANAKRKAPYLLCCLLCAGVMTAFSFGIEVFDSLVPILREGDMTAAEFGSAALSLLIYLLHGAFGFTVMALAGKIEVIGKKTGKEPHRG